MNKTKVKKAAVIGGMAAVGAAAGVAINHFAFKDAEGETTPDVLAAAAADIAPDAGCVASADCVDDIDAEFRT